MYEQQLNFSYKLNNLGHFSSGIRNFVNTKSQVLLWKCVFIMEYSSKRRTNDVCWVNKINERSLCHCEMLLCSKLHFLNALRTDVPFESHSHDTSWYHHQHHISFNPRLWSTLLYHKQIVACSSEYPITI